MTSSMLCTCRDSSRTFWYSHHKHYFQLNTQNCSSILNTRVSTDQPSHCSHACCLWFPIAGTCMMYDHITSCIPLLKPKESANAKVLYTLDTPFFFLIGNWKNLLKWIKFNMQSFDQQWKTVWCTTSGSLHLHHRCDWCEMSLNIIYENKYSSFM